MTPRAGKVKVWCAEARDGHWCALSIDEEPDSHTSSGLIIPHNPFTKCRLHINLPQGFKKRSPTCRECYSLLNPTPTEAELVESLAALDHESLEGRPETSLGFRVTPYAQLDDDEKEFPREQARKTIALLRKLGVSL